MSQENIRSSRNTVAEIRRLRQQQQHEQQHHHHPGRRKDAEDLIEAADDHHRSHLTSSPTAYHDISSSSSTTSSGEHTPSHNTNQILSHLHAELTQSRQAILSMRDHKILLQSATQQLRSEMRASTQAHKKPLFRHE